MQTSGMDESTNIIRMTTVTTTYKSINIFPYGPKSLNIVRMTTVTTYTSTDIMPQATKSSAANDHHQQSTYQDYQHLLIILKDILQRNQ
jgi:hypothetical protein